MYTEDVGKKGGNNVASLIWANVKRLGTQHNRAIQGDKFCRVMDNCCGQNENWMVLRMLHYLVKKHIAIVARIIFSC